MAIVIGIGALVVLLAFIAWDRCRIANAPPVVGARTNRGAGSNLRANALAAVSLAAAIMAVTELLQPRLPPFTGRWSFLYELAYGAGPFGLVVFWAFLAAALATAAVLAWRSSSP